MKNQSLLSNRLQLYLGLCVVFLVLGNSLAVGAPHCPDGKYDSVRASTVTIPGDPRTIVSEGTVTIEEGTLVWTEREGRELRFVQDEKSQRQRWVVDKDSFKELAEKSGTTEEEFRSFAITYAGMAENLGLHVLRLEVGPSNGGPENKKAHPDDISYLFLKAK